MLKGSNAVGTFVTGVTGVIVSGLHTRVYEIRVFYISHEGSSQIATTTKLILMNAGQYNAGLP